MKAVFLLFLVIGAAFAAPRLFQEQEYEFLFKSWVQQHNKAYTSVDETLHRYNIFKDNLDWVTAHNNEGHSYTVAMNQFGDLTNEEYKLKYLSLDGVHFPYARAKNAVAAPASNDLPDTQDWTSKMNPVKDQGQCGSCWAFSAVAAIEGRCNIKTGINKNLAEQELVDCSKGKPYDNEGCNGGWMDAAFQYVHDKNGLAETKAYPYVAKDQSCKAPTTGKSCPVTGFTDIPENDLKTLRAALVPDTTTGQLGGPVSIAIEADKMSFQFYSSGVYDATDCGTTLDHGVALVGYGSENGKLFWKVRNSWGSGWGRSGYIYMIRTNDATGPGQCGLAMAASYPLL